MRRTPRLWLFVAALAASPASFAQNQGLVVRDGTAGTPRIDLPPAIDSDGVVLPGPDDLGTADYLIRADLGEQRGGNLFHSFSRFSIGTGERATFTDQGAPDPGAIDNVISRVTGGSESRIDGTLHSTIPGADVWLLNPSGVVFGEGAKLDVPGSFHASTGDYVGFEGSLERFYADGRPSSVLSTAQPEAFGFLGEHAAKAISVTGATLDVSKGETLSLVGGDVVLDGATLEAENGRVNLAAVASAGEVGPASADAAEPLEMRGFEALGEVRLEASGEIGSLVNVSGDAPGMVFIRGGKLVVEGHRRPVGFDDDPGTRSRILAENDGEGPGGRISVETSESVLVDNGLLSVDTSGAGNAGTIHITSPEVTFQNGPGLFHDFNDPTDRRNWSRPVEVGASAVTAGSGADSGAGGRIEIEAETSLTLQKGVSVSAGSFGIYPQAATGDGGSMHIKAGSLQVLDRSNMTAGAFRSEGNAGSIEIDVRDSLRLDGTPQEGTPREQGAADYAFIDSSKYFNVGESERLVPGALGTIDIEAGVVEVLNHGTISSDCGSCTAKRNPGDPPNISIKADRIVVAGAAVVVGSNRGTEGDSGKIEIEAASLELLAGSRIEAFTNGAGNAGDITIDADWVSVSEGGSISTNTNGSGAAGTIAIGDGTGSLEIATRGEIVASTRGSGRGGSITVDVDKVEITSEGFIATNSIGFGVGYAGEIKVYADSIRISNEGGSPFSLLRIMLAGAANQPTGVTGIFSAAILGGKGGEITLKAPEITIEDGAFVSTATVAGGDAGKVELTGDRIQLLNGGFVDSTSLPFQGKPGGAAGDVTLVANESIELVGRRDVTLNGTDLQEWSHVSSTTLGSGTPGAVTLVAPRILVDGGAVATAAVAAPGSAGGDITVTASEVDVRNGGRLDASTFIDGPGGNIDVIAQRSIVVEGEGSAISSRTGGDGTGGNLLLSAPVIEVREGGEVSADSRQGLEAVGEIFASLIVDGLLAERSEPATGDAGSIKLAATKLVHLDDGDITTSVGSETGGNITIDSDFVALENGSTILATADMGHGGAIRITADNYFAFPGSVVSADSGNPDLSGIVEVHAPDVDLAGNITALPTNFLDAASLMKEACAARRSGERAGSFAVRGNGGIPAEPDGWLPAAVSFEVAPGSRATSDLPAGPGGVPLFALGSCR